MSKMNAKIREIGIHRRTGSTLQSLADRINPMLRGWLNYFTLYRKHDVRPILYNLENRLLGWARNRHKRLHGSFQARCKLVHKTLCRKPAIVCPLDSRLHPDPCKPEVTKGSR
ncbi:MAG: hypothetical protein IPP17_05025 [Bacteroidetes bacterium]|nr:hypothetical protein [Bacteroidota bacterium]